MESTLPGTAFVPPASAARRRVWVWGSRAAIVLVVLGLVAEVVRVTAGGNFHCVIPGEIYRSAQLSGPRIERVVRERGIRTVVNLRGRGDGMDWYADEALACQSLGISQENLTFSASRLPSRTELGRLIEVFDRAEKPLLLHCRQGADRTGLATATYLLLTDGYSYADARSRMGLRWGHWRWGPAGELGRFFEDYEDYLANRAIEHSPSAFRVWATEVYHGGPCRYEVTSFRPMQDEARAGEPVGFAIGFRNLSDKPWRFRSISRAGIHAHFDVVTEDRRSIAWGFAGLFEKVVPPGETVEVPVVTNGMPAGRHRMRIDLVDGERGQFFKIGQEPIERELIVRE